MKRIIGSIIFTLIAFSALCTENTVPPPDSLLSDTLSRRQGKKLEKKAWRQELRKTHSQFFLKSKYVFAGFKTTISSEIPQTILTAKIGLEENLNLPIRIILSREIPLKQGQPIESILKPI